MAIFGLFKRLRPRNFDYVPRYYDPVKEDLANRLKKHDPEQKDNPELIKHRIRSGFRSRSKVEPGYRKKSIRKSNIILLAVIFFLLFLSYYFLTRYLPKIMEVLG